MNNHLIFAFGLVAITAPTLLGSSFDMVGIKISIAVVLLYAIPWYFQTRNKALPPSRFERALAFMWLAVRRIICFSISLGSLLSIFILINMNKSKPVNDLEAVLIVCALIAALTFWLGMYGAGKKRGFSDDVGEHQKNKERYKWKV